MNITFTMIGDLFVYTNYIPCAMNSFCLHDFLLFHEAVQCLYELFPLKFLAMMCLSLSSKKLAGIV